MNDRPGKDGRDWSHPPQNEAPRDGEGEQPPPKQAQQKHSWFPGWIWGIPVAAAILVAYLVGKSLTSGGPEVTVIFPEIANLRPDNTKVMFEGYTVGQVKEVHIEKDLAHMRVKLELNQDMENHLGPGTQFWILGKTVGFSNITDIKALVEGASIGISPRPGKKQKQYEGLTHSPAIGFGETGTRITLHASQLGSVQRKTAIYYFGEKVGKVVDTKMTDTHDFEIDGFVDRPFDALVHTGTRFWRAGPIRLSTGGNGPRVQFQSIPALFQGAIDFETPDGAAEGPVAKAGTTFRLYDSEDAAKYAPDGEGVAYRVVFPEASGVPADNAPVDLMGKRVGTVQRSALQYSPADGTLSVIATIVLEPHDIRLSHNAAWTNPRAQMDEMVRRLVAQGLRAELTKQPPLIGGEQVSLHIVPGKSGTLCESCPVPEIPTTNGDGSIAGIETQASDLLAKINAMQLDQIGNNLRDISQHLAKLTSSPELPAIMQHLDRSAENIQDVTSDVGRQIPLALAELRRAVDEAQKSLSSAQDLLSARGVAASTPGSTGLPETLYEIKDAARAVRELADLLDRHPTSLILGRGSGQ